MMMMMMVVVVNNHPYHQCNKNPQRESKYRYSDEKKNTVSTFHAKTVTMKLYAMVINNVKLCSSKSLVPYTFFLGVDHDDTAVVWVLLVSYYVINRLIVQDMRLIACFTLLQLVDDDKIYIRSTISVSISLMVCIILYIICFVYYKM
jgi:hypothetical protein